MPNTLARNNAIIAAEERGQNYLYHVDLYQSLPIIRQSEYFNVSFSKELQIVNLKLSRS